MNIALYTTSSDQVRVPQAIWALKRKSISNDGFMVPWTNFRQGVGPCTLACLVFNFGDTPIYYLKQTCATTASVYS